MTNYYDSFDCEINPEEYYEAMAGFEEWFAELETEYPTEEV